LDFKKIILDDHKHPKLFFWNPNLMIWIPKKPIWMTQNSCFGWSIWIVSPPGASENLEPPKSDLGCQALVLDGRIWFRMTVLNDLDHEYGDPKPKLDHPKPNLDHPKPNLHDPNHFIQGQRFSLAPGGEIIQIDHPKKFWDPFG